MSETKYIHNPYVEVHNYDLNWDSLYEVSDEIDLYEVRDYVVAYNPEDRDDPYSWETSLAVFKTREDAEDYIDAGFEEDADGNKVSRMSAEMYLSERVSTMRLMEGVQAMYEICVFCSNNLMAEKEFSKCFNDYLNALKSDIVHIESFMLD